MKMMVLLLLALALSSGVLAAEPPAPSLEVLQLRAQLIQAKRDLANAEYLYGKTLTELAVMKDAALAAEAAALAAQIKEKEAKK